MTIRCFIAIDLPEATRQGLDGVQEKLQQSRARVRWVRANNIHLTLKFLGNIHPDQVDDIAAVTAQTVQNEPPLTLRTAGLGAFPSQRNPRVIWMGVAGEVKRLTHIQTRLENNLQALGFASERRGFRAHLTLGRVKDKRNRQALIAAMTELEIPEFDSFDVTEIILYKSDLRPTGAIYTKLHRMPLAAPASP